MSAVALHPARDRTIGHAVPQSTQASEPPPHPRLVVATAILAANLAFIDGSVVNVGLPAIGRDLAAGGDGLAWVVNAYLLPLSALLLVGGAAGDIHGRRRLLILGVGLFALASVLCAVAPGLTWLLSGRALQGVGAAMLMPNSLAILGATFTGEARGRAGRIGPRMPLTIGPIVVSVGFVLFIRMGDHTGYWTTTLPAMVVMSLGMAAAVAPLTTAVLASVAPAQTGVAAGLNSAVARVGGLILTALASVVLAAEGPTLLTLFHIALLIGAGVSLAAGVCAFLLVRNPRPDAFRPR